MIHNSVNFVKFIGGFVVICIQNRLVIPAKAGIKSRALYRFCTSNWTPACAGVTR